MLYFLPTPIGNLSDISLHTLELLQSCEIIICEDTRKSKSLCKLFSQKYELDIRPKSFMSLHSHNEEQFFKGLDLSLFNKNIAYLSDAGMPGISDPGLALVRFAQENNILYEVITGANALLLAVVASGLCEKEFIFLAFLRNKGKQRRKDIENLLANPYPSVVYESPLRVLDLIKEIALKDPLREIFAIKEASKKYEKMYKNTACKLYERLKDERLRGEWTLVVAKNKEQFLKPSLSEQDIIDMDLPLKSKAKLLAKLRGENAKSIYKNLN